LTEHKEKMQLSPGEREQFTNFICSYYYQAVFSFFKTDADIWEFAFNDSRKEVLSGILTAALYFKAMGGNSFIAFVNEVNSCGGRYFKDEQEAEDWLDKFSTALQNHF